jgi:hypothetical protein
MFGFFKKDPVAKLEKTYQAMMAEAVEIQRSGDLRAYAAHLEKANEVADKIQALKAQQ